MLFDHRGVHLATLVMICPIWIGIFGTRISETQSRKVDLCIASDQFRNKLRNSSADADEAIV